MGSENELLDCDHLRVNLTSTCLHQDDAGVVCALPCTDGELRIVGTSATSGHVELCVGSDWVSVCGSNLTAIDATMVCSRLGFPTQGMIDLILSIQYKFLYFILFFTLFLSCFR